MIFGDWFDSFDFSDLFPSDIPTREALPKSFTWDGILIGTDGPETFHVEYDWGVPVNIFNFEYGDIDKLEIDNADDVEIFFHPGDSPDIDNTDMTAVFNYLNSVDDLSAFFDQPQYLYVLGDLDSMAILKITDTNGDQHVQEGEIEGFIDIHGYLQSAIDLQESVFL